MTRRAVRAGFTLVEMIVALGLFGLIGELVMFRGIQTALDLDRNRVAAEQRHGETRRS